MGFYNEIHETNEVYPLKNEQNLLEFQRIFTGYRVLADHVEIKWWFNERRKKIAGVVSLVHNASWYWQGASLEMGFAPTKSF
jgi:hypothetical protein